MDNENEVARLKDVIAKVDEERQAVERKLQRRVLEVARLRQTLAERDEEIAKKSKQLQSRAQQVTETKQDAITLIDGYSDLKAQLAQLESAILLGSTTNSTSSTSKINEMIQAITELRDDNVRLAAECNSLREDANFFNKRINWLEETVASLEVQLQSESERKQVAEAKMVFLVSKLQLYEEAAEEITAKVMEETSLKGQILNRYLSLTGKYVNDNSKQPSEKKFIVDQLISFENTISEMENVIQFIEKNAR